MAYIDDDRPRDSLGRPTRRKRYPVLRAAKFSQDASDYLDKMAERRGTKPATIIRRAVMKEIYIDKRKKEQRRGTG
jgi:hypothetical protein